MRQLLFLLALLLGGSATAQTWQYLTLRVSESSIAVLDDGLECRVTGSVRDLAEHFTRKPGADLTELLNVLGLFDWELVSAHPAPGWNPNNTILYVFKRVWEPNTLTLVCPVG
jgi:hypothetical protein